MEQARFAVVVGIDHYEHNRPLRGCVADADAIASLLREHHDETRNFTCELLTSDKVLVTRAVLRKAATNLFVKRGLDIALFFYAGHGALAGQGSCLVTYDGEPHDEGIPMAEIIALANASDAREKVIIFDCCSAGAADQLFGISTPISIGEGVSVLAACRSTEEAVEKGKRGAFSEAICAALGGGAADVRGNITVASIYAFVDQMFSVNEQRPVLKASVDKLVTLRTASKTIDDNMLREKLVKFFPTEYHKLQLDKSFEPTEEPNHPEHEAMFADLQKLRGARLVTPDGDDHMYYAAMKSLTCSLTPLGRFYWRLATGGKI